MGDGVMVLHGLKLRRDQDVRFHPAQSVMFAINVLQELTNYNRKRHISEQMHVRIGIASGEITAGTFRNKNRLIFTALGIRANMAARLQEMAEPDTILISDELQSRLECENSLHYQSISCGEFELRGFNRPIKACVLKLPGLTAGGSQSSSSAYSASSCTPQKLDSLKCDLRLKIQPTRGQGKCLLSGEGR